MFQVGDILRECHDKDPNIFEVVEIKQDNQHRLYRLRCLCGRFGRLSYVWMGEVIERSLAWKKVG